MNTQTMIINIPGDPAGTFKKKLALNWLERPPYSPWYSPKFNFNRDNPCYSKVLNGDEYLEAKGTILWLPLIKHVVNEGIENNVINKNHEVLFENILFGLIAVETNGLFAQTGNFGISEYQKNLGSFRGLSQIVSEKHDKE